MRVPPVWLGRAVASACALALAHAWWSARSTLSLAPLGPWSVSLAGLTVLALCGRVLLAWLPPGRVGGHGPAQLADTWAASHLLGLLALALVERLVPALASPVGGRWLALAIGLLAALRLLTLPAAMVPRHASAHERPGALLRALERVGWALVLVLALALASGSGMPASGTAPTSAPLPAASALVGLRASASWPQWLAAAHYLAIAILLRHALQSARLAPAGALCAWCLCLFTPAFVGASHEDLALALGLTSGAGFAVGWLRRASRRSLCLSLAGWTYALLAGGLAVALAGMAATLLASARASRARFAASALPCLFLGLLAAAAGPERGTASAPSPASPSAAFDLARFGLGHAAALFALALCWFPALPRRAALVTSHGLRIDPPEEAARLCAAVFAAAHLWAWLVADGSERTALLLSVLPSAGLFAAAVFVRSEAPGGPRAATARA